LSKRLTVGVAEVIEFEPPWRTPGGFQVDKEQSSFLRLTPVAVSKEVPDFKAGGHRAHDLDVVGAHPHLEEDLVHLFFGVVDAILFASDLKETLDSNMLVADAVPRPRVLWIGLAASGERNTGAHGKKEFELTIASNEATSSSLSSTSP
jgi:hypothetical protein